MVDLKMIRVIALAEVVAQENLIPLLQSLEVQVLLIGKLTDLTRVASADGLRDIILLPDECSDGEAWIMSGFLSQYTPRPPFLVYARQVDFATWSGVLDSGGVDVLTPPYTIGKLRTALQLAAEKIVTTVEREH